MSFRFFVFQGARVCTPGTHGATKTGMGTGANIRSICPEINLACPSGNFMLIRSCSLKPERVAFDPWPFFFQAAWSVLA